MCKMANRLFSEHKVRTLRLWGKQRHSCDSVMLFRAVGLKYIFMDLREKNVVRYALKEDC